MSTMDHITRLLDDAVTSLKRNEPAGIVWRCLDAATMAEKEAGPNAPCIGRDAEHPTGMGIYIGRIRPACANVSEARARLAGDVADRLLATPITDWHAVIVHALIESANDGAQEPESFDFDRDLRLGCEALHRVRQFVGELRMKGETTCDIQGIEDAMAGGGAL